MDALGRRIDTARILGNLALVTGLLITVLGLATDDLPAKGYFFAGMLVFVGIGLRLEASLAGRR
jgi:uncharacterized membrane protein YiaA